MSNNQTAFICINSKPTKIKKKSCPIFKKKKIQIGFSKFKVWSLEELKLISKVCLPYVWIMLDVAEDKTVKSGLVYAHLWKH